MIKIINNNRLLNKNGFTLIELSIVLIIISLIVGGVIGGKSLIHQAELKKIISDYNNYSVALNNFKDQYVYPPGDLINASDYWPSCTDDGINTCNGNGNNIINGFHESIRAWQHLSLAALVNGTYSGIVEIIMPGNAIPNTSVKGNVFTMNAHDTSTGLLGTFGAGPIYRGFFIGTWGAASFTNANLSAKDVKNIDVKLDDGLPAATGLVGGFASFLDAGVTCEAGGTYAVGDPDAKCVLVFRREELY